MGGCRCVYRKCPSSTAVRPGLHYFHFPVRDPPRCEEWIKNAQKPEFKALERDKLRNKVICSLHFTEKCFTNEKHDRLVHNAVPTLGFEEENEPDDPLLTTAAEDTNNIMLIPIDDDNTKFALPDVGFAGMSYTIFDDAVIPTSKVDKVIVKTEPKNNAPIKLRFDKPVQIKSVIKTIKPNVQYKKKPAQELIKFKSNNSQDIVFKKVEDGQHLHAELKLLNEHERSNNNIPSYSVSTLNGDVSVEPSTHILPDIITENLEQPMLCEYQNENSNSMSSNLEDISIQLKSGNEYTMSVTPTPMTLVQNISVNENMDMETAQDEIPFTNRPIACEQNDCKAESLQQTSAQVVCNESSENAYMKMIKNNSKQIRQLKKLVHKQNSINRYILQRKRMPHFKPRKQNKFELLDSLKQHVKPSLLAILKLEMLPQEEVVLNDNEEKFITDLYTEHPQCYNLLRTKFKWNLPSAEKIDEPSPDQ